MRAHIMVERTQGRRNITTYTKITQQKNSWDSSILQQYHHHYPKHRSLVQTDRLQRQSRLGLELERVGHASRFHAALA